MPAISGVYAAAITPRREGPEIDLAASFEVFDFLCDRGVDGIALMGSTGEFPHFSIDERVRLVSLAVKRSRVPVLAGASHSTFDGALALARAAAGEGVAGILLTPPYYFAYGQDDVKQFYLRFAEEFKEAAPIVLYSIPAFSAGIPRQAAAELLATGLFAGIKDSTTDWGDFAPLFEVRKQQPFSLMVGHDILFARARAAGADGIVSGLASAVPELLVALDRAIVAGDSERAKLLDGRLQEFISWNAQFAAPVAIREATALRGLKPGPHASPVGPEGLRKLEEFKAWFPSWLNDVLKECGNG